MRSLSSCFISPARMRALQLNGHHVHRQRGKLWTTKTFMSTLVGIVEVADSQEHLGAELGDVRPLPGAASWQLAPLH